MAKTTNINIRLEPELKEQAELILGQLGIPVSSAVNMFLKQVVMQRGIPFDVKLPIRKPIGIDGLTESELNKELEEGYQDYMYGKVRSSEEVFNEIREDYEI